MCSSPIEEGPRGAQNPHIRIPRENDVLHRYYKYLIVVVDIQVLEGVAEAARLVGDAVRLARGVAEIWGTTCRGGGGGLRKEGRKHGSKKIRQTCMNASRSRGTPRGARVE